MKARRYYGIWDSDSGVAADSGLPRCRWVAATQCTLRKTNGFWISMWKSRLI